MAAYKNEDKTSQFFSALRGGGQGVSLGFSDELAGLGAGAMSLLGLRPDKPGTAGSWEEAKKEYASMRDDERRKNEESRRANPKTFGGAELLSSLLVPTPVKGAAMIPVVAGARGAIQGAGLSEANTAAGVAKDATTSGLLSALIGGAVSTTPALANKASELAARNAPKAEAVKRMLTEKTAAFSKNIPDWGKNSIDPLTILSTLGGWAAKGTPQGALIGAGLGALAKPVAKYGYAAAKTYGPTVADFAGRAVKGGADIATKTGLVPGFSSAMVSSGIRDVSQDAALEKRQAEEAAAKPQPEPTIDSGEPEVTW